MSLLYASLCMASSQALIVTKYCTVLVPLQLHHYVIMKINRVNAKVDLKECFDAIN